MTPSKPYLIRALYEWIVDNECTPYLLVAAEAPGVIAPEGFAEHGQLILNLSPSAVRHFVMNNQVVSFEARFSGVPHQLVIPVYAVLAIYAQETGRACLLKSSCPRKVLRCKKKRMNSHLRQSRADGRVCAS